MFSSLLMFTEPSVNQQADLLVDPLVKWLVSLSPWWSWLATISFGAIILRLALSILLGGILGVERASKRHAAGFRTYILCSIGACVAAFLNQYIIAFFGTGDGARLGAGVIGGIGFLCAGSILVTSRNQIKGLTTAASLWASGSIGLAIGQGFYSLALAACVLVYIVLRCLPRIENYFTSRSKSFTVHCELNARTDLKELISTLRSRQLQVRNVEHNVAYAQTGLSVYSIEITVPKNNPEKLTHDKVIALIESLPFCTHAEVIV